MAPRKPRPEFITRADAEAMIADAVAAERARSEQAMAGFVLALGGAAQSFDLMGEALGDVAVQIDRHEVFIAFMESVLASPDDGAAAGGAPQPEATPS